MYRIFCDSFTNFNNDFKDNTNSFRYKAMRPFELLVDYDLYLKEKNNNSLKYKKIAAFLYNAHSFIYEYPSLKAFLWTMEGRGFIGEDNNSLSKEELDEQLKIVNMILKLAYW